MDTFIDHKEKSKAIEESTAYHYRKDARVVCRYIGDKRLCDVGIPTIQGWVEDMVADGLAPRSVAKPFRLLRQALKFAVAQDLIRKNPCDFCKPPKQTRKKVNALSRAERTRMLNLVEPTLDYPVSLAIELALMTGMRRGEICGLRWSDINEDQTITVNRSIGTKQGGIYVKEPKTTEGHRVIPLTPRVYAHLAAKLDRSKHDAAEHGYYLGDPYILGEQIADGKPYQPNQLTREFHSFCQSNGFSCSFHDLRHTFATMLISQGVDIRTVASYLGHANVAVTLNMYAEVDPDAKRAAVSKITEGFDIDNSSLYIQQPIAEKPAISFTVEQLEQMLAEAKRLSCDAPNAHI